MVLLHEEKSLWRAATARFTIQGGRLHTGARVTTRVLWRGAEGQEDASRLPKKTRQVQCWRGISGEKGVVQVVVSPPVSPLQSGPPSRKVVTARGSIRNGDLHRSLFSSPHPGPTGAETTCHAVPHPPIRSLLHVVAGIAGDQTLQRTRVWLKPQRA